MQLSVFTALTLLAVLLIIVGRRRWEARPADMGRMSQRWIDQQRGDTPADR